MQTFAHRVRQLPNVALLAAVLVVVTGCQSFATGSSAARFRVIDLSADAGAIDIYQGNRAVAYNLTYGAVTSYMPLAPGSSTTTIVPAGAKQLLSVSQGTFAAGAQYTLLINGSVASLQQTILSDQALSSPSQPGIRLIHQAERTGPVDVYLVPAGQRLASLKPVVTNLAPGAATGYLPVPPGVYAAVMLSAGTPHAAASLALHTGRQVEYLSGSAHTLILLDAAPTLAHRLEVIETMDAEPAS